MSKKTQIDRTSERAYPYLGSTGENARHVLTPDGAVIIRRYKFDGGPLTTFECSAGGKRHEERHDRHYSERYLITLANRFAARVQREQARAWSDQIDAAYASADGFVDQLRADHVKAVAELQKEIDGLGEANDEGWSVAGKAKADEFQAKKERDEARRDCRELLHILAASRVEGQLVYHMATDRLIAKYLKPEPSDD